MKNKHMIDHINRHINKYIVSIIIIVIMVIFLSKFIPDYIESKKSENYDFLKESVIYAYSINHNILSFNEDNIAVLKMDVLYNGVKDDKSDYSIPPIYNNNFEQCAGYIVVTRMEDNDLRVDISHFCDMIDY